MVSPAGSPRAHPRRRPMVTPPPALASGKPQLGSPSSLSLRKGETFHPSVSPPADRDPVVDFRSLPRRSPTDINCLSPDTAGEQRMAEYLGNWDLNAVNESSVATTGLQSGNELPVPRSFVQAPTASDATVQTSNKRSLEISRPNSPFGPPAKIRKNHDQALDSALGNSITNDQFMSASDAGKVQAGQLSVEGVNEQVTQSAITSSISAFEPNSSQQSQLGPAACYEIDRIILTPILNEDRLRPFFDLVKSIPQRIASNEIQNLRDLEKTLLWLTPSYSPTTASFIDFWNFTIQNFHTACYYLTVRDQQRPTDRPYSTAYLHDFVLQIRQHAAWLHECRCNHVQAARQSAQPADVPNVQPTEPSVATSRIGTTFINHTGPAPKRTRKAGSPNTGARRSMARRKKNAPPMDINQKCANCDRVFKRYCDITKHEKTHTRPYKCTKPDCRFNEIGWPTQKERDRHVNDRHSDNPNVFRCLFDNCPYQSKRESNCKQHMEKTHNWTYVRSKNNGKSARRLSAEPTPQSSSMATPTSGSASLSTPNTGPGTSPSQSDMAVPQNAYPSNVQPQNRPFSFAAPPAQTANGDFQLYPDSNAYTSHSNGVPQFEPFPSTAGLDAFQAQLEAADPNGMLPLNFRQSFDSSVPDLVSASAHFAGSPMTSTDSNSQSYEYDMGHFDQSNYNNNPNAVNTQLVNSQPIVHGAMHPYSNDPLIALAPTQVNPFDEGVADLRQAAYQPQKAEDDFSQYGQNPTLSYDPMNNPQSQELFSTDSFNAMFTFESQQQPVYMNQPWTGDNSNELDEIL